MIQRWKALILAIAASSLGAEEPKWTYTLVGIYEGEHGLTQGGASLKIQNGRIEANFDEGNGSHTRFRGVLRGERITGHYFFSYHSGKQGRIRLTGTFRKRTVKADDRSITQQSITLTDGWMMLGIYRELP